MATLIAVYTSSGCVGRCDAKCYDAQSDFCDCICGGKNHGTGLDLAVENSRNHLEEWLEEYAKRKNLTNYKPRLHREVQQWPLFDTKAFSKTALSKG